MGRRPLMSVSLRRFTIDIAAVFGNKEDESVVEGGVVNLQTMCAKAGQRSVPNQKIFLNLGSNQGERNVILQKSSFTVIRMLEKYFNFSKITISQRFYSLRKNLLSLSHRSTEF